MAPLLAVRGNCGMSEVNEETEIPQSDYSRPTIRDRQGMRTGYTTGSCAAAAAKAATLTLLSGNDRDGPHVQEVTIRLPIGEDATFQIHRCEWSIASVSSVR